MENKDFLKDYENINLFSMAVEFNLYPVRYIHLSWLSKLECQDLIETLKSNKSAQFYLSEFLLDKFRLNDEFDYEFSSVEKRVALSSSDDLSRLAFYLGIILNEKLIRASVLRSEKKALEACLGEEAYRFAVKKAQFISPATKQSGPCFLIDWDHLERFKHFLTITGLHVIACAFSGTPVAFRKRLSLKMPRQWQKHLKDRKSFELNQAQCIHLMLKTHREVNRQWRHLLS